MKSHIIVHLIITIFLFNCKSNSTYDDSTTIPIDGRGGGVIAFYSPRSGQDDIYVINADGVEENPVWSPDGTKIIFQSMRDGNFELYIIDHDGGVWSNVTNHSAHDYWPTWVLGLSSDEG